MANLIVCLESRLVEIIQDSVVPLGPSVVPAIRIDFRDTLQAEAIPITAGGIVLAEDDKFISDLILLKINPPQANINFRYWNDNYPNPMNYTYEMLFRLDKQALNYIENARLRNKKRDVVLKFNFSSLLINFQLRLGYFNTMPHPQYQNTSVLSSAQPGQQNRTDLNLRLIVANQPAVNTSFINTTLSYTIRSSDWVNDFQGPLGLGKFLVVEIPQPGSEDLSSLGKTQQEMELRNRLDRATEILQTMESDMNKGNWDDVVADSRNLIELFRKPPETKDYIKEIIAKTTSIEPEKANSLTESIDRLYGYASDLHHTLNKEGKMKTEVFTGGKEDAYMVYMLSASLVNLLRRKFKVYVKRQTEG